jgi:periplasmic protein TonB
MKKSKKANLESKRFSFLMMGFVVVGAIVLSAFTYRSLISNDIAQTENEIEVMVYDQIIEFDVKEPTNSKPSNKPILIDEVKPVDKIIDKDPNNSTDTTKTIKEIDIDGGDDGGDGTDTIKKTVVYEVAPISPEFPGGPLAMSKFIQDNFVYPEISREMREQGTVWIEFIVKSDGSITGSKIVQGVSSSIDKECIKTVNSMPKWIAGEKDGKKVNVRLTIPIKAKLG